jgi:hypothetical protein
VDRAWALAAFVEEQLEYAIKTVATSEQQVLPKPIPLTGRRGHHPWMAGDLHGRRFRYDRGNSAGQSARVMATTESWSADRKKVHFPPPKAWDPGVCDVSGVRREALAGEM